MIDILVLQKQYSKKIYDMICDKNESKNCLLKIHLVKKSAEQRKSLNGDYFIEVENFQSAYDIEKVGEMVAELIEKFPTVDISIESPDFDMSLVLNGFFLSNWRFDAYKKPKNHIGRIFFKLSQTEKATFEKIQRVSNAVLLCRYLSYLPANVLNPDTYEEFIVKLFQGTDVKVRVLRVDQLKELGMNLVLAVGNASQFAARVIILQKGENPKIAFVGKGVTFDTGGLSLKNTQNMEGMSYDMAGSAAVVTALFAYNGDVPVYGVLPIVENSLGSKSYRPSDIFHTRSGKTVEVGNTDAEGRLILADAAHFAAEALGCKTIICVGTLTGAVKMALGCEYAALLSRDIPLIQALLAAWKQVGEKLHALPFDKEYEELACGKRADIRNVGNGEAGTIFGWLFIKMLCPEGTRFAGIDIAFSSHKKNLSESDPLCNGLCVRAIIQFLESFLHQY